MDASGEMVHAVVRAILAALRGLGSDFAGNLGSLMGGIATVVAVTFAWREVDRWKKQRAEDKTAEVAGQCYVALSDAMKAANTWAWVVSESPKENTDTTEPIVVWAERAYDRGFARANVAIGALDAARPLAEVYLPALAREPIEAAEGLWLDMWSAMEDVKHGRANSAEEMVAKVAGFRRFQGQADGILERGKKHLLPLARRET